MATYESKKGKQNKSTEEAKPNNDMTESTTPPEEKKEESPLSSPREL